MTTFSQETALAAELAELAAAGLTRRCRRLDAPCAPHTVVEGREMLAFASNDYLGLANHPAHHGASFGIFGRRRPHQPRAGSGLQETAEGVLIAFSSLLPFSG